MAVQVTDARQHLTQVIHQWEQRRRWQQVSLWLPRVLIVVLVVALLVAVISRLTPLLDNTQLLGGTVALAALAVAGLLAGVMLRPRPTIQAAQRFDLRFDLRERISTALELIEGKIHADPALAERQIDDAVTAANRIDARQSLPYSVDWRAWGVAAVLLALLLLLVMLVPPALPADAERIRQQTVIEDAAEAVRESMQDIAADETLNDDDRRELLEALQASLNTLRDQNITPEEAFATLKDVEGTLSDQAEQSSTNAEAMQAALAAAAQALNEAQPESSEQSAESAAAAAAALAQMLEQMSPEERAALEEALAQAAQQMQQAGDQNATQALENAQQMIQQGDLEQARQALENAAQQMQNAENSAADQQENADSLQQQSQNFQQLQQELGQQGQEQPQSGEGQSGGQGEGGEEGGEQGQGSGMTGEQAGQADSNTGTGESSASNDTQNGGQTQTGSGAQGAGDGAGDLGEDVSTGGAGDSAQGEEGREANNNPDGLGVGQYEAIFAPQFQNAGGEDEIRLNTDPGDVPAAEGEFSANPTGRSVVPYAEVFSDYANAANHALETDYIPLGLRDLVRQYFTSLEPRR